MGLIPTLSLWVPCPSGKSPTWLNPVDTRCSWVPVHASRPSLLFLWASVLWRRQKRALSRWGLLGRGALPESPTEGRRGRDGDPQWLAGDRGGPVSQRDGPPGSPWLRTALHPEGRPGHQAWAQSPSSKGDSWGCAATGPGLRAAAHPCPCRSPGGRAQWPVASPRLWGSPCFRRPSFLICEWGSRFQGCPRTD